MSVKANPNCKRYSVYYPNTIPIIYSLSDYTCIHNTYHVVYVYGDNFYPNKVTTLDFIGPNKIFEDVKYVLFTNKCISFIIPNDAFSSTYSVRIKNVDYRQTIPAFQYSNLVTYTLT